jgi:hypothetical protein
MDRQELANQWVGETCTLDGEPAKVVGRLHPFGAVSTLDYRGQRVEFCWETIDRIMRKDGQFST